MDLIFLQEVQLNPSSDSDNINLIIIWVIGDSFILVYSCHFPLIF